LIPRPEMTQHCINQSLTDGACGGAAHDHVNGSVERVWAASEAAGETSCSLFLLYNQSFLSSLREQGADGEATHTSTRDNHVIRSY
jgi:hypothetical protein